MPGTGGQTFLQGRKTERGTIHDIEAQLDRRLPFAGRMQKDGCLAVRRPRSGDPVRRLAYRINPEGCGRDPDISETRPVQGMIRPNVGCTGLFALQNRRHWPDRPAPPDDLCPAFVYAFFASR